VPNLAHSDGCVNTREGELPGLWPPHLCQAVDEAGLNLAHRWYLGYAFDDELPDHSNLTRIRQRMGSDVFAGDRRAIPL
jgi:hypothetical protein